MTTPTRRRAKIKDTPKPPDQWAYEYNRDLKIPADFQVGLNWIGDEGEHYRTEIPKSWLINGKRVAHLIESSFTGGLSIGAMHFYGRIEVPQVGAFNDKDNGYHGGYLGKNAPKIRCLSIQVTRRLTKVEKDMAGEVIGKIGDYTYRFNSEEDVLPEAIKTFKRKFGPGWVLVKQYENKVLCET